MFTKSHLRDAFPSVEQIDRRVRDLRAEGWTIATSREDLELSPDEQRLVTIGGHVWQPGYQSRAPKAISDKERRAVLSAAGYRCVICGASAGDTFPDDPVRTARLGVQRLPAATGAQRLAFGYAIAAEPPRAARSWARASWMPWVRFRARKRQCSRLG